MKTALRAEKVCEKTEIRVGRRGFEEEKSRKWGLFTRRQTGCAVEEHIMKRLSEASALLCAFPQTEVWGFGMKTALRAEKVCEKTEIRVGRRGFEVEESVEWGLFTRRQTGCAVEEDIMKRLSEATLFYVLTPD